PRCGSARTQPPTRASSLSRISWAGLLWAASGSLRSSAGLAGAIPSAARWGQDEARKDGMSVGPRARDVSRGPAAGVWMTGSTSSPALPAVLPVPCHAAPSVGRPPGYMPNTAPGPLEPCCASVPTPRSHHGSWKALPTSSWLRVDP
ncbi:unnamed protein product, partial [Gulo gulo]